MNPYKNDRFLKISEGSGRVLFSSVSIKLLYHSEGSHIRVGVIKCH